MAGDKTYSVKVVVYPFSELDRKKRDLMAKKEVGLNIKPKNFQFADKFTSTSVRWNGKKIEEQAKAMFRYDLSLLAAQMWQAYVPIEKAKNGQDKKKITNKFLKEVPRLMKAAEKKMAQSFVELKEDISSGATDDVSQLKATRKTLTAGHPEAMVGAASKFFDGFEGVYKDIAKLKKAELRASGDAKEDATEELDEAIAKNVPVLQKALAGLAAVLKKRVGVVSGIPAAMKKSMNKDLSDAAKSEFKSALGGLEKAISPLESQVSKYNKAVAEALQKMKRKTLGASTYNQVVEADGRLSEAAEKMEMLMQKIDAKLKKLEQTAKKR